MTDSSQMIPPHESDASEAVNRSPSSRGGSQRGAAANNGYRRRAERNQRGGFNQQHHRSNYYPTPLVGPHTEFYTPPRAVFDLPPQFLPPHMFNANVVPVSERDANFELQFGNYSRNVPYINNDGLFIPPQQQLQPQEFIPSEQQPEEVYANGLESQLGQLFIPTQQQRQPQEFIPSEQPSQEVYTNGLESQLEQLNVGGNEDRQLTAALDVPSRHRQKSPRSTDRSKNASHSNATQPNRRHVNAQNRKSRGGSGSSLSKRGNQRGRGAAAVERQMQRPAAYSDLESFPLADSSGIPAEEGYGCPPSYLLETYRDETDRQQMAAAAAAASALLPSRGRRNGTQIFPGRRRGHSNQPNNQFSGIYQVSNEQIQRRNERKDDDGNLDTLRDRLKKQLEDNTYECMICCQTIQANQWIWTCSKCFHMFHMNRANTYGCITQWAAKSFDPDLGWRCPSCQNLSFELPKQYRCFCGKRLNPATQRFPDMPHSCNAICGKSRGFGCPHKCSEQCHPGPCPECPAMVTRSCNCGAETKAIRCGTTPEFQCSKVCDKMLNCGVHKCAKVCHKGGCGVCEEVIVQTCYCGLDERTVPCTALNLQSESYSCGAPCDGMYSCGIHKCDMRCHPKKDEDGSCGPCSLSPEKKEYCPCGRVKIVDLIDKPREKCTDPIPTCDNICGKVLLCGSKDKPHRCKQKCHTGPCPPCPDNSSIVCRCKSLKKTIPCKEFLRYSDSNPFTCERRCRKLKSCQNHRCQAMCCVDTEHFCMQICNKKLDCGNHNCDRLCHVGQCPRCLQASFEEQYCLCGHTVREPPIPCGTPLPPCDQPCSRQHACEHPPMHNCHSEPECPPCTVLTQKECYGGHEIRSNIPCYLNDVSCGRPCDKALPCGVHTCKRICHPGECLTAENPICKQPCTIPREGQACDHACGLPCHGKEPCPKSVCTEKIMVTCACQRKTAEMRCVDVERAYQKMMAVRVSEASEESDSSQKRILKRSPSMDKYRCLPCDSDCRRIMRNKKVASALSIPTDSEANNLSVLDGTVSSVPTYTDFLKAQLQKSFKHVLEVENALVDLVHAVELHESGATRTHIFRPMTSENRRLIHEYACYFRVETVSYDAEPKRNVVATAKCGSSCVPCVLLTMLNNPNGSALGHIVNLPSLNSQNQSVASSSSSVPSVGKDFSWTTNTSGMQQLQPVGKVVKRGFSEAAQNTSK